MACSIIQFGMWRRIGYVDLLTLSNGISHSTLPQRSSSAFLRHDLRQRADDFANLPDKSFVRGAGDMPVGPPSGVMAAIERTRRYLPVRGYAQYAREVSA